MKREDRLIREMATELYERLQKEGALGVPEPYDFVIRTLRKSIRKAYKAGQEEQTQVPTPKKEKPEPQQEEVNLSPKTKAQRAFCEFLQLQNIQEQFLKNYEDYHKHPFNLQKYLRNQYASSTFPGDAFYGVFPWSGTPEGTLYWMSISRQWSLFWKTYKETE